MPTLISQSVENNMRLTAEIGWLEIEVKLIKPNAYDTIEAKYNDLFFNL